MIRVTHQFHHITPDPKLGFRWNIMLFKAAVALVIGDTATYSNFCNTVSREFSTWKHQAESQCKSKSHKNWLGGGDTYSVLVKDPVQGSTLSHYKTIFSGQSKEEIMRTYQDFDRENYQSLYSPIYSL